MTILIRSPRGLDASLCSLRAARRVFTSTSRTSLLAWTLIASSMATNCYLNAAENHYPTDEELAAIRDWKITRDDWLKTNAGKDYLRSLCSLTGDERARAWEKAERDYLIIPPDAVARTPSVDARGYRVLDCARENTSALSDSGSHLTLTGYTWSNRHGELSHA